MKFPSRRFWVRLAVAAVVAFAVLQVVPYGAVPENPPVVGEPQWDSTSTRALAKQACFDCHSNETRIPRYGHVAPASWLVRYDIVEGREKLNFSEWQRTQKEAHEAAEAVREGEMPPLIYQVMHPDARLSDADRDRLARGLTRTVGGEPEHERH